jgi:hypothetical protein
MAHGMGATEPLRLSTSALVLFLYVQSSPGPRRPALRLGRASALALFLHMYKAAQGHLASRAGLLAAHPKPAGRCLTELIKKKLKANYKGAEQVFTNCSHGNPSNPSAIPGQLWAIEQAVCGRSKPSKVLKK